MFGSTVGGNAVTEWVYLYCCYYYCELIKKITTYDEPGQESDEFVVYDNRSDSPQREFR